MVSRYFFRGASLIFFTVLTSDPAIPYLPNQNYLPYDNGNSLDVFMKSPNGNEYLSLVWPGEIQYPLIASGLILLSSGVTVFPGK